MLRSGKMTGIVLLVSVYLFMGVPQAQSSKELTVEEAYPGLATGVLRSARVAPMKSGVLVLVNGKEIRESTLEEALDKAEPQIRDELRRNLFFLLEQEVMKEIILQKARASGIRMDGISDEEAMQSYFSRIVEGVTVDQGEIKAFYEENREMVGGIPLDQVKENIEQFLLQKKKQDAVQDFIRNIGADVEIRINGEWVKPQFAAAKDNPVDKARMSGKPTLVEFGATGCVPCDMMQPILDKLQKNYSDRLNVVFVHVGENPIAGARFGIRSIPVQVFFDQKGEEVFRHTGFFAEAEVMKQLEKMGVK
jgi:thiol-disulfide isomerase/thioredoxin